MQTFSRHQTSLGIASQRFMKIQEVFVFPALFVCDSVKWRSGGRSTPVLYSCQKTHRKERLFPSELYSLGKTYS